MAAFQWQYECCGKHGPFHAYAIQTHHNTNQMQYNTTEHENNSIQIQMQHKRNAKMIHSKCNATRMQMPRPKALIPFQTPEKG